MTELAGGRTRALLRDLPVLCLPAAAIFAGTMAILYSPSSSGKVTTVCDHAVHQLLTTNDPIELQRSIFLIRWFNCGIRQRLP